MADGENSMGQDSEELEQGHYKQLRFPGCVCGVCVCGGGSYVVGIVTSFNPHQKTLQDQNYYEPIHGHPT